MDEDDVDYLCVCNYLDYLTRLYKLDHRTPLQIPKMPKTMVIAKTLKTLNTHILKPLLYFYSLVNIAYGLVCNLF
jgi:hypothetical protein